MGLIISDNPLIVNSYSIARVSIAPNATLSSQGGLVGASNIFGLVTNSYWDKVTSQQSFSAGGIGYNTAQMQQQNTYSGFDFTNNWKISAGDYPHLKWESWGYVSTCQQLQNINNNLNGNYELINDISCANVTFSPIGSSSNPFLGTLEGQGHTISGLKIYVDRQYVGLFASIQSPASISDIVISAPVIEGSGITGSVAGQSTRASISHVVVNGGTVFSSDGPSGGLVGRMIGGFIYQSAARDTNVQGGMAGGLVGAAMNSDANSKIRESYSTGSVNASQAGGLIGESEGFIIEKSYSLSHVLGSNITGGLVGSESLYQPNFIINSFAAGRVNPSNFASGGVVGSVISNGSIPTTTGTYWDTDTTTRKKDAISTLGFFQNLVDIQW